MAIAFFNRVGLCTCVLKDGSSVDTSDDVPFSAPVADGTLPSDVYYDTGSNTVKPRGNFGVNVLRGKILNIPPGTIASTLYGTFVVMDGELELESGHPGARIKVVLIHPHFKDKIVEVATI